MARRTGTIMVAISAVLYSIGGLCMKVIPWNGMSINGGRTAIAVVVVGLYLLMIRHPLKFNRWIFLGALCIFGAHALYAIANKMTTAANAIILQFTAPIFILLFSAIFLHKKPGKVDYIACAVVFSGIIFCFVDSLEMGNGLGDLIALLSGVAYAGVFLMREMPDSDAISSVFWGDLICAVTGLPFLFQETEFPQEAIISLVLLGVFQVALAYILLTAGLAVTPPVTACLISGIEPILNPILVALFYRETVGPYALVGAAIVIIGVVGYNLMQIRQSHPEDKGELVK